MVKDREQHSVQNKTSVQCHFSSFTIKTSSRDFEQLMKLSKDVHTFMSSRQHKATLQRGSNKTKQTKSRKKTPNISSVCSKTNFLLTPLFLSISLTSPHIEIRERRTIIWLHWWKQERASALKVCVYERVCMRKVQVCCAESTITISLSFLWAGMPCTLDND